MANSEGQAHFGGFRCRLDLQSFYLTADLLLVNHQIPPNTSQLHMDGGSFIEDADFDTSSKIIPTLAEFEPLHPI